MKKFQALFAGDSSAAGREDAGYGDKVALLDSGIPKGQLERLQFFLMGADAVREKDLLRDSAHQLFLQGIGLRRRGRNISYSGKRTRKNFASLLPDECWIDRFGKASHSEDARGRK